jgi:DNA-binding NarL/FixJ family response regulator
MTSDCKLATSTSGTETSTSNVRELPPFMEGTLSQWESRYAGDDAARPSSRVGDPLTARERDVLAMVSQGLTNKRIARALEISPETVKTHVKHIFVRLEVRTRTEAAFRALSLELL